MPSRSNFVIEEEFVRARRAFDDGRGPAEAWTHINTISLWRLDELAKQAGSRTWALLVAPVEPGPQHDGMGERVRHAVRSVGLGAVSLPVFWRLSTGRVALSRVLVVFEIEAQRAVRLACRHGQVAVVHVQRIPFEQVLVLDVVGEQRVEMPRYDPAAIADALARMVGADAVAVEYLPLGWFESLACTTPSSGCGLLRLGRSRRSDSFVARIPSQVSTRGSLARSGKGQTGIIEAQGEAVRPSASGPPAGWSRSLRKATRSRQMLNSDTGKMRRRWSKGRYEGRLWGWNATALNESFLRTICAERSEDLHVGSGYYKTFSS